VIERGAGSIVPPTVAINAVPRDDWITATGRSDIAVAATQKA